MMEVTVTRFSRRAALAATLLSLLTGWDTRTVPNGADNDWYSIHAAPADAAAYAAFRTSSFDSLPGNEHTEISHYAFTQLGWESLYTTPVADAVDLNAAIWHPEVAQVGVPAGQDEGDDAETPLLERRIPHPARFTGMPDYSYTISDWINRNRFCPSLPSAAPNQSRCHAFAGWLGAVLNSSHFGDQATAFYRHFHAVALARAEAANQIGAAIEAARAGGTAFEEAEAARYQREAEVMALAYEAYAQHFLQDRWSSGHTWNRWNAGSYEGLPRPNDYVVNMALGGITGVVHGAEAVLSSILPPGSSPDPLCSPEVTDGAVTPIGVHGPSTSVPLPVVGDYRFADGLRGRFLGAPMDVSGQLDDMMRCAKAGYADVARRFHPNPDGSRGAFSLAIGGAPTFDREVSIASDAGGETYCFDHWATNEALDTGLNTLGQGRLGQFLADGLQVGALVLVVGVESEGAVDLLTQDFARMALKVHERALQAPERTDLARGETLPALYGVQPGQAYVSAAAPAYAEPVSLSALPLLAREGEPDPSGMERPGRDQRTLMGFFNRALAPELCERAPVDLRFDPELPADSPRQGLRWPAPIPDGALAEDLERRRHACVLLADRLFEETYAWYRPTPAPYEGRQREQRRESLFGGSGDSAAPAAAPMCQVLGATPEEARSSAASYWDDNPVELHPGYVSAESGPYARVPISGGPRYESLDAWCRAVPVVHVDDEDFVVDASGARQVITPGFDEMGRVSFEELTPWVTLHGRNFGVAAGRIKLVGETGCNDPDRTSQLAEVASWTPEEIAFELDAARFPPDIYRVEIIRDDRGPDESRVRSVGRFRLDVRRAVYTGLETLRPPFSGSETGQDFRAIHPFCEGGTVIRHTIDDCTDVFDGAEDLCGADGPLAVGTRLWTGPTPSGFTPGPYPSHQYAVTATGLCSALPFGEPCPDGLPIEYGLVWRMELTGMPPGPRPPRRWRYTLAWERAGAP